MANRTTSLPEGVLAPLTVDNKDDRGGLIIVVSALSLSVAFVLLGIRAYIQKIRQTLKVDDIFLAGATLLFCVQSSFVFSQVHEGWGKTDELLLTANRDRMLKAAYISDILYIFTLYTSKCSGAFFYLRISPGRALLLVVWAIICATTMWTIVSVLLLGIRCNAEAPWADITEKCSSLFLRWEFVTAVDMALELAIAGTSIILVHNIQISAKQKVSIVSALSSRLIVFIPTILHLYYLHRQLRSSDPTYDGTYTTVCAQIQLAFLLVANTIPCLKPFIAAYEGSDSKLTFRGQSGSPQDSRAVSHDEEKHPETKNNTSKGNRRSQEHALLRHSASHQHRRSHSGHLPPSPHSFASHRGPPHPNLERKKTRSPLPLDVLGHGAIEHERRLPAVAERLKAERNDTR